MLLSSFFYELGKATNLVYGCTNDSLLIYNKRNAFEERAALCGKSTRPPGGVRVPDGSSIGVGE